MHECSLEASRTTRNWPSSTIIIIIHCLCLLDITFEIYNLITNLSKMYYKCKTDLQRCLCITYNLFKIPFSRNLPKQGREVTRSGITPSSKATPTTRTEVWLRVGPRPNFLRCCWSSLVAMVVRSFSVKEPFGIYSCSSGVFFFHVFRYCIHIVRVFLCIVIYINVNSYEYVNLPCS